MSQPSSSSPRPLGRSPRQERFRPLRCVGNWQLTQITGRGNFTEVYLAKPLGCRPDWHADYAVKTLRTHFAQDCLAIDTLQREFEVASQVSHQHLVAIFEAHLNESPYYLVMPRLKGVSVAQVIDRTGYLAIRQALWITRQIAEALDALHRQNWLHGDIKPENIMLSPESHATLIDLGFALRKSEAMLTDVRTARGTLDYVAPEVMTSALCSDERSDLYSVGISLFHMLTGKLPYVGRSPGDLIEAHRGQPLPDPRQFNKTIPLDVVQLIGRLTAKQPVRRPATARELIAQLIPLEVTAMEAEQHAFAGNLVHSRQPA